MLGLIIKSPWIDLILQGRKTWEIRGSHTHTRGLVALIKSRSGSIVGTCRIGFHNGALHPGCHSSCLISGARTSVRVILAGRSGRCFARGASDGRS